MKVCTKCNRDETETEFYSSRPECIECGKAIRSIYRSSDNGKSKVFATNRKYKLKTLYGITPEEYERRLIEQKDLCLICGEKPLMRGNNGSLCVDHKDSTIRGLLCYTCNLGLGNFKDDPSLLRAAIKYLEGSDLS